MLLKCREVRLAERADALPTVVLLLIGVVLAIAAFVVTAMNRKRDHPLRDRFSEFGRKPVKRDDDDSRR